ncbi:MAG: DUF2911 domain-containing protein [Flavisolibacter sp.]|nr:DUF2911 domain-containing protein [Flavisolibacter sp.]
MKLFFLLVYSIIWISCNRQSKEPSSNIIIGRDTNVFRPEVANPYVSQDISPVDISYYPVDYPVQKMTDPSIPLPVARIIYSRPQRQGRSIFGSLLKFGEPWRLGANEATEIELFQTVRSGKQTLNKGRYILYCIPQADKWTIHFNTNIYSWGLTQHKEQDVYTIEVPVQKIVNPLEYFTIVFQKTDAGADVIFAWDEVEARLPLIF